jgi:acyl carrier protein
MADHNTLVAEASKFVSEQLGVAAESIQSGSDLKSMGLDSFRIIELVLFLERRTGLSFPEHFYTPGNLTSLDSIVQCFMKLER